MLSELASNNIKSENFSNLLVIQFYFLPSELAGNSIKSAKIYDRFDKFQSVQSGA